MSDDLQNTNFEEGDRVILRETIIFAQDKPIPAGTLGTVIIGFAKLKCVHFDNDPPEISHIWVNGVYVVDLCELLKH